MKNDPSLRRPFAGILLAFGGGSMMERMVEPGGTGRVVLTHLLAMVAPLILWETVKFAGLGTGSRVERLKAQVVAAISELMIFSAAGVVFFYDVGAWDHPLPLGWMCVGVVLLDRLILAYASPDTDSDWMLDHVPVLRCGLVALGIGGHLAERLTGAPYWLMGSVLMMILGFSAYSCIRRYRYATGASVKRRTEAGTALDVKS